MSQFSFLQAEFASVFEYARRAEVAALADPRGACFYARLALESAVKWMYENDRALRSPYDTALSALIHEGTFRTLVGNALVTKARIIKDLGNTAVHETRPVPVQSAVTSVRELFHFSYWFVRTYARGAKPDAALAFNADNLPRAVQVEASTLAKLKALAQEREESAKKLAEEQAARVKSEVDRTALDTEVKRLQAEIAAITDIARIDARSARLNQWMDYYEQRATWWVEGKIGGAGQRYKRWREAQDARERREVERQQAERAKARAARLKGLVNELSRAMALLSFRKERGIQRMRQLERGWGQGRGMDRDRGRTRQR